MDVKAAAERWEVSEKTAKEICEYMQVDIENIPEDLVPVWTPQKYGDDPHRFYLAILDVVMNTHLELEGIDPAAMAACLIQLQEQKLIVPKNGRPSDSGDYRDYILSPYRDRFYSWHDCRTKGSVSILKTLLSLISRIFIH